REDRPLMGSGGARSYRRSTDNRARSIRPPGGGTGHRARRRRVRAAPRRSAARRERHAAVSRATVHTASTARHTDSGSSTRPGAGSPAVGMPAEVFDVAWATWPAGMSDAGSAEDAELCEGVCWVGCPKECIVTTPNRTADNRARRTAQATHLCLPVLTTCLPVCGLLPGGYPGGVTPPGPAMVVPG